MEAVKQLFIRKSESAEPETAAAIKTVRRAGVPVLVIDDATQQMPEKYVLELPRDVLGDHSTYMALRVLIPWTSPIKIRPTGTKPTGVWEEDNMHGFDEKESKAAQPWRQHARAEATKMVAEAAKALDAAQQDAAQNVARANDLEAPAVVLDPSAVAKP